MVHVQFKIDNINMKKYKLGDFLDNYGDGIHGTPKYDINGDYYFINGSNLGNGKIVINDDIQKVSAEEYTKIRRPIVNGQTILVSINGTLGKFAIYHGEKIGLGKSACFLNLKEAIYVPFIFAILMTKEFKTYLHNIAGQSTIKNVSPNQIANYEFYAPSSLCDCIAYSQTILKINEKIELNRLINDNLEAMAKQLYDYWFVQFDFPNEEGKPYKASGGAMVWNEKLKREIPQGLGALKIGDIEKNIITGKTPSCADEDNFGGDIPFVTIDDIRGNLFVFEAQRTLSTKGADSQEKKYLPIGSLSVSCIGTIGVMGFVAKLAQTNQQINSIVFEHEYNKEFLYFSLRLYFENAKAKTGNVFANMSKEEFTSIIVAYPPKQILQAFHNKVAPIFDSIKNNTEEINSLTKQRDELLPLLMNGQATVNYHLSDD